MRVKKHEVQRFLEKVEIRENGCWEWTACIVKGYGQFRLYPPPRQIRANRYMYSLVFGEIPDGMWVLHKCDNSICVNPAHLWLGTPMENVHDMITKGRKVVARGAMLPHTRLTDAQVAEIRRLYVRNVFGYKKIGRMFNVNQSHVHNIIVGRSRKLYHTPEEEQHTLLDAPTA